MNKNLLAFALGASATWMLVWGATGVYTAAYAAETDALYGEPVEFDPVQEPKETYGPWRKTHATFYGPFYDSGPGRKNKTSDGTPYRSDGMFCATYLVPLGTVIEVKRGKVVLRLVVRDRPAKKNGHKIDIPTKTWDRFGAKRSIGKLPVEWREVKK